MAADLAKGSSSDLSTKLEPKVESLAKPSVDWLLQGRAEIQRDEELKKLFLEDRSDEWKASMVASRLAGLWGGNIADASQVAEYLVDERRQLGDGIYLVSSETGRVIAQLTEEDIYQPEPVPRTTGELAVPLPRIDPGTEALIVTYQSEKGREERILSALAARANQTDLQREDGDSRLWVATRAGRVRIAQSLSENHPKRLLERAGGSAGAFLSHFDMTTTPPEGIVGVAVYLNATSTLQVNDPLTTNLSYDRLGSLRGVFAQGWVRELAKQLSLHANVSMSGRPPVIISDGASPVIRSCEIWVMDPEVMLAFMKQDPKAGSMYIPANGAYTIGFSGKIGTLVVPDKFDLSSHEVHGRWEVSGGLDVTVYIPDWSIITVADVRGVGLHAEVVS